MSFIWPYWSKPYPKTSCNIRLASSNKPLDPVNLLFSLGVQNKSCNLSVFQFCHACYIPRTLNSLLLSFTLCAENWTCPTFAYMPQQSGLPTSSLEKQYYTCRTMLTSSEYIVVFLPPFSIIHSAGTQYICWELVHLI